MAQEQKGIEAQATEKQQSGGQAELVDQAESSGEESKAEAIESPQRPGLARPELWTSPFSFVQRMVDEMDRMFSRYGGVLPSGNVFASTRESIWSPSIEAFEKDGRLVLRADLPGLERKDVKVEVEGDELVISGERKQEVSEKGKGRYYSERRYGSFERRMLLPENFDADNIEASFDNGVLEVSLAIPEAKAKTRTIEVRTPQESGPRSVH